MHLLVMARIYTFFWQHTCTGLKHDNEKLFDYLDK
jgi:hypothetical protein